MISKNVKRRFHTITTVVWIFSISWCLFRTCSPAPSCCFASFSSS